MEFTDGYENPEQRPKKDELNFINCINTFWLSKKKALTSIVRAQ